MVRKGARFKAADLVKRKEADVRTLVQVALAEKWEAQAGHALEAIWNPPNVHYSGYYVTQRCPRCQVLGGPNEFWDWHSPDFCTNTIQLHRKLTAQNSAPEWDDWRFGGAAVTRLLEEFNPQYWSIREQPSTPVLRNPLALQTQMPTALRTGNVLKRAADSAAAECASRAARAGQPELFGVHENPQDLAKCELVDGATGWEVYDLVELSYHGGELLAEGAGAWSDAVMPIITQVECATRGCPSGVATESFDVACRYVADLRQNLWEMLGDGTELPCDAELVRLSKARTIICRPTAF